MLRFNRTDVPTDNPFYDGAGPNVDAIWALGLRNPFRASYDPPTGRLYIGDVGGNVYSTAQEEVHVGVAGANYGWPICEGFSCGSNPTYTSPIYAYPTTDGMRRSPGASSTAAASSRASTTGATSSPTTPRTGSSD